MLPLEAVHERVAWIRQVKGDPEAAHGAEDDLRRDVLQAIADGAPDPAGLAQVALATECSTSLDGVHERLPVQ